MGLDMYAFTTSKDVMDRDFLRSSDDANFKKLDNSFFYWRKFYELDNWMKDLFYSKGGTEEFNCAAVRLTRRDIDKLVYDSNINSFMNLVEDVSIENIDKEKVVKFLQNEFWSSDIKYFNNEQLPLCEMKDLISFIRKGYNILKDENICLYYTNWW